MRMGATVFGLVGVRLTVAVPEMLGLTTLVAMTVTVVADEMGAGAV